MKESKEGDNQKCVNKHKNARIIIRTKNVCKEQLNAQRET